MIRRSYRPDGVRSSMADRALLFDTVEDSAAHPWIAAQLDRAG